MSYLCIFNFVTQNILLYFFVFIETLVISIYSCGVRGCFRSFRTYNAFSIHCTREHSNFRKAVLASKYQNSDVSLRCGTTLQLFFQNNIVLPPIYLENTKMGMLIDYVMNLLLVIWCMLFQVMLTFHNHVLTWMFVAMMVMTRCNLMMITQITVISY